MSNLDLRKTLSSVLEEDFIDRTVELERLLRHGKGKNRSHGLLLLAKPAIGGSELLRQVFDHYFFKQTETVPFYFSLNKIDVNAKNAAARFLQTFLQQLIAFRKRDSNLLESAADIDELAQLSLASDGFWIDRLIAGCRAENVQNDDRLYIKNCLSAPVYAAAHGVSVYAIIDDLHEADFLTGDIDLIEELKEIFGRAGIQYVFSGRRRFMLNSVQTGNTQLYETEILSLEPLEFNDAGILAENLSAKYEVKISDQSRDLIARKFRGNPFFIKSLFQAAKEKNCKLENFHYVEQVYADEIFEGRIGAYFDRVFDEINADHEVQKRIIGLLFEVLTGERRKSPLETWRSHLALREYEFERAMRHLNNYEIVRMSGNLVEVSDEGEPLPDYVSKRFALEIQAKPRVLVIVEALKKFLKRAPNTMANFYRLSSAVDLRALLGIFNCQSVPPDLIDYSIFRERHKGVENIEILEKVDDSDERMTLPQIVYTAPTTEFYEPIGQFIDSQNSAVALGFETANYTDENEVIWLAAEIESKLEAPREVAEFWCDRLEMVALVSNFQKFKIWLIAPEGFSPEALEVLKERNAFGSSRKQIDLLKIFLKAEDAIGERQNRNEYEMVVPMGEDTELIAAHTVEEIARRHEFDPRAINQIKTALVEACINAVEHSLSPDKKIYQKFAVEDDKITITISNRGVRIGDRKAADVQPDTDRRGWGLKLLRSLMDDVTFEHVNDGTRIRMTKYLNPKAKEAAAG